MSWHSDGEKPSKWYLYHSGDADDEDEPTSDVVEVVRCKDCAVPHNKWLGCPNLNGLIPPPDFYCARGKRKDGADE